MAPSEETITWLFEDTDNNSDCSDDPSESCSPLDNRGRLSPFIWKGGTRRLRRTAEVVAEEMRRPDKPPGNHRRAETRNEMTRNGSMDSVHKLRYLQNNIPTILIDFVGFF